MVLQKWRNRRQTVKELRSQDMELREQYLQMRAAEQKGLPTYDSLPQSNAMLEKMSDRQPATQHAEVRLSHTSSSR
ncbi:hypothetical protein GLAREA_06162 [Glarea lozoyensis ATCC 20868]|uniref:Uncharacterized protein n=1 Tax=Glarea lozoyensis (strain ATCC 20868 / MF5171) TaxID=1116229 RepID=S3D5W6_GLAL2|nr:uncharacterized protein GLAREA_06162 [Glarea lozoyensis ATCC 20868]EPE33150.1 hypothetical protein GLAREA_06162 [Glarea lozoyensis ATCC 20868]